MFSLLLTILPACLIFSCVRREPILDDAEEITVTVDSCWFELICKIESNMSDSLPEVNHLDILIYDAAGVGSLESWNSFGSLRDTIKIRGAKRAKNIVAIANSPRSFNRNAIERFDSMSILEYEFDEDLSDTPIMSACTGASPGREVRLTLEPLMSRVRLSRISNNMKSYVLMEDPRIYLENMNSAAEVLQRSGFRPAEFLEGRREKKLPWDIGFFAQQPMTCLYCYPNDSNESTLGTPHTKLVLECEIKGATCRFPVDLPALGRNKTLNVELSISSEDSYESKVY